MELTMVHWGYCSLIWLIGVVAYTRYANTRPRINNIDDSINIDFDYFGFVLMSTMFAPLVIIAVILFCTVWTLWGVFKLIVSAPNPFGDVPHKITKFFAKFERQTVPFPEVMIVEEVPPPPMPKYNWSTCTHCGAAAADWFNIKHLKTCQHETKGSIIRNSYKPKRIVGRKVVKE